MLEVAIIMDNLATILSTVKENWFMETLGIREVLSVGKNKAKELKLGKMDKLLQDFG